MTGPLQDELKEWTLGGQLLIVEMARPPPPLTRRIPANFPRQPIFYPKGPVDYAALMPDPNAPAQPLADVPTQEESAASPKPPKEGSPVSSPPAQRVMASPLPKQESPVASPVQQPSMPDFQPFSASMSVATISSWPAPSSVQTFQPSGAPDTVQPQASPPPAFSVSQFGPSGMPAPVPSPPPQPKPQVKPSLFGSSLGGKKLIKVGAHCEGGAITRAAQITHPKTHQPIDLAQLTKADAKPPAKSEEKESTDVKGASCACVRHTQRLLQARTRRPRRSRRPR